MKIVNKTGYIEISDDVIAVIAGYTALNCMGVKAMTEKNFYDGIVSLLKGSEFHKGVRVTHSEGNINVDLHIAVDRDVNIKTVAASTINEVRYVVEKQTGLKLGTVNVFVDTMITPEENA